MAFRITSSRDLETAFVSEEGISRITIRQLERVEVDLGVTSGETFQDIF